MHKLTDLATRQMVAEINKLNNALLLFPLGLTESKFDNKKKCRVAKVVASKLLQDYATVGTDAINNSDKNTISKETDKHQWSYIMQFM